MIIYIVIFIIIFLWIAVIKINKYLVFQPYYPSEEEYDYFINNQNADNIENLMIANDENKHINVLWLNKNSQHLIIYVHGNSGWIGSSFYSETISILKNYGSVVLFDYSGYGASQGNPSENQTYKDIELVIKYFTDIKNISSDNIILYGFSLGTGIVTKFLSDNQDKKFKAILLEAPYLSIKDVSCDINHLLKYLVMINYDNYSNLKKMKNENLYIIHSKSDEIINFYHGKKLSQEFNIPLIEVDGLHNSPKYDNKLIELLNLIYIK